MDAFECVATKLDVREFDTKRVPADVKLKVLDAARMAGTGMNMQHWPPGGETVHVRRGDVTGGA